MKLYYTILIALPFLFIAASDTTALAQQADQQSRAEPTLDAKRQFVRASMIREFADSLDANLLSEIDRKVAAMPPSRIDQLVENYQKRQQAREEVQSDEAYLQKVRDEATRQALIAQYQQRLAASRSGRNPGFSPVITTLPSGAQLGASAVVSPDRRYVRMNLQPFFSSVGPVQTFTFQNPTPFPYRQPQRPVPFRPR